ncbi:hypothetical protein E4O04_08325 [Treponema sp. OMZ 799]|uniref:PHB depolymerase family esterase n=1 Tax=Treponema sp. OMZ 799 TaxID=2563668 RepID=UPI0020A5B521|nr:PHB depolymerase family esterase [Treponema sp. OMZ 799]UTC78006.1 hypothetical protein E4O04_08325 [Treponema sp. OMZ 799]
MKRSSFSFIILSFVLILLSCVSNNGKIINEELKPNNLVFEAKQITEFKSGKTLTYKYYCPKTEKDKKKTYPLVVMAGNFFDDYLIDELTKKINGKKENVSYILLENTDPNSLIAVINDFRSMNYPITDDMIYLIVNNTNTKFIPKIKLNYEALFANIIILDITKIEESIDKLLAIRRGIIYNAVLKSQNILSSDEDSKLAVDGKSDTIWTDSKKTLEIVFGFDKIMKISRYRIDSMQPMGAIKFEVFIGNKWQTADNYTNNTTNVIDRCVPTIEADKVRLVFTNKELAIKEIEIFAEYKITEKYKVSEFNYKGVKLPYRLFIPQTLKQHTNIPLVVFLHGSGQRGSDNRQTLGVTKAEGALIWAYPENQKNYPCVVLVPQIDKNQLWRDKDVMDAFFKLVEDLQKTYPNIDKDRIYGTGLSIGAEGLANMSIVKPDFFAAMLLVAGGPNNPVGGGPAVEETVVPNVAKFANIPMWEMQAFDDNIRNIKLTTKMINAYRDLGFNPKFTVYLPGETHKAATNAHSSWLLAYKDNRIFSWLFKQNKNNRLAPFPQAVSRIPQLTDEDILKLAEPGKNYVDFDKVFK